MPPEVDLDLPPTASVAPVRRAHSRLPRRSPRGADDAGGTTSDAPGPTTAPGAPAPTSRIRRFLRSDLGVGTMVGLAVFAVLLARNAYVLRGTVHLGGDEANQFGTAWDAITLRELRGNGSRIGFHHPGPGYLYVWGAADVLRRILGSPFGLDNWDLLATMAFVAAQLGAVAAIVRSHLGTFVHGAVVLVALAVLSSASPGILAGPWLPFLFLTSFTLMIVAGASAAAGRPWSLVAFAVSVGFLWHGHIAFTSFVGVAILALLIAMWRTGELSRTWHEARAALWSAVGVLVLFAAPVVTYTLTGWPGELDKYWDYVQRSDTSHTVVQGARFALQYWPGWSSWSRAAVLLAALAGLAAASWWRRSRFGGFLVGAVVLMQLMVLQYAVNGVDDLSFSYVALFSYSLPALTIGVTAALLVPRRIVLPTQVVPRVALGAAFAGVLLVGITSPSTRYRPPLFQGTDGVVDHLEQVADGRVIAIDAPVEVLGTYWVVPAVVSDLQDRGERVCLIGAGWEIKYSERIMCDAAERRDGARFTFFPADQPLPAAAAAAHRTGYQTAIVVDGAVPRS